MLQFVLVFPFLFVLFLEFQGVFASFGLSGIIPAVHYGIMEGWFNSNGALVRASLGWLILMGKSIICWFYFFLLLRSSLIDSITIFCVGLLYILGAIFYALRVPERWFPGKFDLWVRLVSRFHR